MTVLVGPNTRVVVQGATGKRGWLPSAEDA
jgi:hypothetical protein